MSKPLLRLIEKQTGKIKNIARKKGSKYARTRHSRGDKTVEINFFYRMKKSNPSS